MATSKTLNGLQPSRMRGGAYNSSGMNEYSVANGSDENIFQGDLVKIVSGKLQKVSATTDLVAGVFMGAKWVDSTTKQPTWSNYFPADTSSAEDTPTALVLDDPNATFMVQADATVADTQIGLNFDVTLGAGSNVTGMSGFGMKGGAGDEATKALRVLRRSTLPGEAATDRYPKFEVKINQHRDHYGLGSVVSIANLA